MKSKQLAALALCGMGLGLIPFEPLGAATLRYRLSGPWSAVNTDGSSAGWSDNANVNLPWASIPGAGDEARVNYANNTVTVSYAAPSFAILRVGVNESGNVVVQDDGVLTTTGDMHIGNNGASATGTMVVNNGGTVACGSILYVGRDTGTTGILTVDLGGMVTSANHLWWGYRGSATINISGTLTQTSGIIGLGTNNALDTGNGGGTATVNILSGGVLDLWNIQTSSSGQSIQPGSLINISGTGELRVRGNLASAIQTQYVDTGKIVGFGGSGSVVVTYDSGLNKTILTAIPEPGSILLLGIAGLGLLGWRRRAES